MADPEISKRGGGTDRMLYTPLTAHAHTKLHAQCDLAGKRGGTCPFCPMLDLPLVAIYKPVDCHICILFCIYKEPKLVSGPFRIVSVARPALDPSSFDIPCLFDGRARSWIIGRHDIHAFRCLENWLCRGTVTKAPYDKDRHTY